MSTGSSTDVAATWREARQMRQEPLIVIEPLEAFMDARRLGRGPISAGPIGEGHSNVTYLIERDDQSFVLRRPPRGPLPSSAHDMLREARMLRALASEGVRVPRVLAVCEDPRVIGASFYLMPFIDGHVLVDVLPAEHESQTARSLIADELVGALVELHAVDVASGPLAKFGRSSDYVDRQLQRFGDLLARNATRPLPELDAVARWLRDNRPARSETTVVHGDYRLGNVMFSRDPHPQIIALLDWEMATVGDPIADVGYMTAMWADPGDESDPMLRLSAVTRSVGFPRRDEVAARYAELSGRDLANIAWYQTFAIWKASIFLEGSYQRYLAGTTQDEYFGSLGPGVRILARRALQIAFG